MTVIFPPDVLARLSAIEAAEGMPVADIVHEAVAVWSYLNGDERRRLGQGALGMLVERLRGDAR